MVVHIAQRGQVLSFDFRQGNASPAKKNLEFIKQCSKVLPHDGIIDKCRIDVAGDQKCIIQYCDEHNIEYAIRAKTSAVLKAQITSRTEQDWQPFISKQGDVVKNQHTIDWRIGLAIMKPLLLC